MKTRTMFIALTATAYAPEGEQPKKLHSGELVYCREAEVGEGEMKKLITRVKRFIEEELGL